MEVVEKTFDRVDHLLRGAHLYFSGGQTAEIQEIVREGFMQDALIDIHFEGGNHNYFVSSIPDFKAAIVAHNKFL